MGKYRRKPSPVDAYQLVDNDWLVIEGGRQEIYTPLEFTTIFEPVVELIDTGIGIFPASQAVQTARKEDATPNAVSPLGGVTIVDPSKL
jgi:hypothetical protein